MSETFTFKLAGTRKKDFFGNSRQDNLVGLKVSDGVSLEKGYAEEGYEEVVLVTSDLGDELGEVPSPYLYQIENLLSRNFDGAGFVKSIEELPSGNLSVTVEITFLPSQKPRLPEPFFTKIRGDEANNADGSSRQTIIQTELSPGVLLGYQREPSNTYDSNAIAILSPTGKQIGYLSSKLAAEFAPLLDAGGHLEINVKDITGGDDPGKSTGVNIHVIPQATRPAPRPLQELSEEVRSARPNPTPVVSPGPVVSPRIERKSKKNFWLTLFLCVFMGYFGVHRFYAGRGNWFFTLTVGFLLFGWIFDFIQILLGKFKDGQGLVIAAPYK